MVRPQIVLFGDSIVEDSFRAGGWGASLSHTFSRKADVIVRGYDGYNTRWASLLLNQLFPLISPIVPCATLVFFGVNDSALLGSSSQRQHVPQDQYKDNLKKIVTHLKELSPSMAVVLVTPLPVDEIRKEAARSIHGDKKKKVPDRTNEITGLYARQCLEVAHEMQLPWIDLWFAMQQMSDWQKLFFDGSQLTEEGNEFVHREVVQALVEAGISAQDMQIDFPRHSEIEESHPEHAFQQDINSSHLVDLDYEEDFVAEMVIPSSTEDSKLTSPSLHHTAPAFELDSLLIPLPDNAFFPTSSCALPENAFFPTSSSSYMAYPTAGFIGMEQNKCQTIPTVQVKEEPLTFMATSSSILPPTHIKEEHPGPTTPLKDDMCASSSAQKRASKKGQKCKKSEKRSSKKAKRRPLTRPFVKSKTFAKACVHCQTTKTPQWRAGPDGSRSLCNACGVRYRMGRLYPEYRPISSPSFVPRLHSNSQREVAELRRLNSRRVDDWVES